MRCRRPSCCPSGRNGRCPNSRADGTGTPTCAGLLAAAFTDVWSQARRANPGYTCCHDAAALLQNPLDTLTARDRPVTIGMLVLAAALFGLSSLRVDSSVGSLMPWLALSGIGIGLTTTPATTAAMAGSDSDLYGMAAGVLNTSRATGLALGIALMGACSLPAAAHRDLRSSSRVSLPRSPSMP